MSQPPLRRLIDLKGVDALELKALMKPSFAEPEAREDNPEIDACVREHFGLTTTEAEAVENPADWDDIEQRSPAEQVEAFEKAGWDVTDNKRRPLRTLGHFSRPLWLAVRGVAGKLPFQVEEDRPAGDWGASLAADAKRFRKR